MATSTSTETAGVVRRNPNDSIKATWHVSDKKDWKIWHWFFEYLDLHPQDLNRPPPVFAKTDKIPNSSPWQVHRWVLAYAVVPMLIEGAYVAWTGQRLSWWTMFALYGVWLNLTAMREIQIIRRLGTVYGYLDGDKHERDGVPDVRVREVVTSLLLTSSLRPLMAVMLAYGGSPLSFMPFAAPTPTVPATATEALTHAVRSAGWLYLELTAYPVAVDFWFYWYHRAMHDVPWLWRHHRTHHLTKHPNTLLSLYADGWQELFDIVVVPVLAFYTCRMVGLPMNFHETWIAYEYVIFIELFGHSGLRIRGRPGLTAAPLLAALDLELTIEDHDLHHRAGWKKSNNYGKQTRIWDSMFGTKGKRIEALEENVDYNVNVTFPMI